MHSDRRFVRRSALALLSCLLAAATPALAEGSDTPELLAAMRASLPPIPGELPHWNDLPSDLRRHIPPFNIGLHRWHADPARRLLHIDGRRIPEDGVVSRELWLREIRPDGVVLQFRSTLFFHPRR